MSNIAEEIRRMRERRGMSCKVLSELCGLSKNQISRYERGEREPTASVVLLLAEVFDCSADDLLGRRWR